MLDAFILYFILIFIHTVHYLKEENILYFQILSENWEKTKNKKKGKQYFSPGFGHDGKLKFRRQEEKSHKVAQTLMICLYYISTSKVPIAYSSPYPISQHFEPFV